jgi:hypothetical protein
MKKTDKERKIVTGIAWYRPEQWARLREVSEDVANLDDTYEAWLQTTERMIRDGLPADVSFERVDLDVEEVLAWCNERGLAMDAAARSRYVAERLRQKYEPS